MYCKNCGSQLPDGTRFCADCGTPVSVQNNSYYGAPNKPKDSFRNPVVQLNEYAETMMGFFRSKPFIIMTVLLIISSVMTIVSFIETEDMFARYDEIVGELPAIDDEFLYAIGFPILAAKLILCAGLFVSVFSAMNSNVKYLNYGNTMIIISETISCVVYTLASFYLLLLYLKDGVITDLIDMPVDEVLFYCWILIILVLIAISRGMTASYLVKIKNGIVTGSSYTDIGLFIPCIMVALFGLFVAFIALEICDLSFLQVLDLLVYASVAWTFVAYKYTFEVEEQY